MNQERINDLLHKVMDIKQDTQQVLDEISNMESAYEEQTGREQALEAENAKLRWDKERLTALEVQLRDKIRDLKSGVPTMPVIPKAVAIAIFREGVAHGVEAACTELEGKRIYVNENEYCGHFEVSFTKEIDLDDELDLDWMRGKCGDYSEESVIDRLGTLCADKEFECRIHGIDDQEEKKND